jgi:hypothetical protein
MVAVAFASCGNKAAQADAEAADSTAIEEPVQVDEQIEVVDSAATDSAAVEAAQAE